MALIKQSLLARGTHVRGRAYIDCMITHEQPRMITHEQARWIRHEGVRLITHEGVR